MDFQQEEQRAADEEGNGTQCEEKSWEDEQPGIRNVECEKKDGELA